MSIRILIIWSVFILSCKSKTSNPTISLSDNWEYRLDSANVGIEKKWFLEKFDKTLQLPGSLRDNDIGKVPTLKTEWTGSIYDSTWFFNPTMKKYRREGDLKFPFWLTPTKRYVGAAWYQKEVDIPEDWENKSISLFLERPHWQTKVWIDTLFLGNENSLSTPHVFTINSKLKPGKHLVTIQVDNAIRDLDVGINSHSISDHTQGNWNGVVGDIYLAVTNKFHINSVKIIPSVKESKVSAKISLSEKLLNRQAKLSIKIEGVNHKHSIESQDFEIVNSENDMTVAIPMGKAFKTWSEFNPNLYKMTVTLQDENDVLDVKNEIFGMRDFGIKEKKFTINGTPIFLRGTTDCSVFPKTGYPPTNEKEWARIFKICKSFGLNHMRFHSYCPPEAAFLAADKAGIYLQVEGPSWAKYSVTLGDGKPIDNYLMDETKRIIDTYGNHPSFCMMAYGNEPSGHYVGYLENWVDHFRTYDPQRVFTGASTGRSWAIIENSDFIVRSPPRGLEWKRTQPESVFDYRDKTENQNRPYVTFEMGQWCAFPNFKEIEKYTGVLKAKNFELFKEDLADNGMGDQAHDFLMASGKLQASCYKQEIEATLRTPNLAGFQLLGLNDFSGQGTALVGVLDAFWDEKGYISAEEFKAFNNQVVPLLRLPKFTFSTTELLTASVEVANFSGTELTELKPQWQLSNEEHTIIKSGFLDNNAIPIGNGNPIGNINLPLNFIRKAEKLTLKVTLGSYSNQWNIWVYPEDNSKIRIPEVYICNELDQKAIDKLKNGEKVLLLASGNIENGKDVVQYFTPVFWNTSWFKMRPPHTTGLLIKDKHPVFKNFPTDYYSDFQWWEIVNNQQVMNLENFPSNFRPIVQPIDTWFLNRKLGMLFEANVHKGKLIVCSVNLNEKSKKGIVSQQLYKSILQYMTSDAFKPKDAISTEVIQELFEKKNRKVWNSYTKENP
ncbi:sugar-binding domain-containing protein [Mariniflexile litorale]|uniref:beta-galactosidase n=1 Tax=Mariniflexile litorale TaxID=3045158 RepID=A0AAU7EKE6_9FLAO|nr:sugar-binding domain-containing protein [Mariniflexile sp. KMM 9835]MDQ8210648.1 glycoside hydrolase family 2 TIM barrel-domain containing protein [Mariniflexile sp. KMM 9835]